MSGSQTGAGLVGSPVVWTATAQGDGPTPVYQYSVSEDGGPFTVVDDFSYSNHFTWDPLQEGNYTVQVIAKNNFLSASGDNATVSYTAESRIVGSQAVVSSTSNPLVALYSAPPTTGNAVVVYFAPVGSNSGWSATSPMPITAGKSTNILVAGMYPNTAYVMRASVDNGTPSAPVTFTTGSLPSNLTFPTYTVEQAPTSQTDFSANIVFHGGLNAPPGTVNTLATDLSGNVVWYYDPVSHEFPGYAPTVVPGGTILMLGGSSLDPRGGTSTLQEINLAGDTLHETNVAALNAQLIAMGQPTITNLSHDADRLPNGDTAVIAGTTRTVNLNGKPTEYDGDMILVLNQNFQVVWNWDPFKWLSTSRLPTLNEGPTDWTHANAIAWSPEDGDLLLSMRAQDWVIKVDYANGTGDGHVVWRLGAQGNFTPVSSDASPWFSHQHDVSYVNNNTLLVFDDGNTRKATDPSATSRGQEWVLNEKAKTATLVANIDLGSYSSFMGSAQVLSNGNLVFGSVDNSDTQEYTPNGTETYVLHDNTLKFVYRSYILGSMYDASYVPLGTPYAANLSSAYNRTGIVNDEAVFGSGLDGKGNALSSTQVGSSVVAGNVQFLLGAAGAPNVVSAAGQTITLPVGNDNALKLLATGVNGNQKNQVFKVTYTDGSTQKFKQSLSNWTTATNFPGQSTALTTIYTNNSQQGQQPGAYHLYTYTFKLNPRKQVQSVTLPRNANVEVFSAALVPATTTPAPQRPAPHRPRRGR